MYEYKPILKSNLLAPQMDIQQKIFLEKKNFLTYSS